MGSKAKAVEEQLEAEPQAHAEAERLLMAALERIPPQLEAPPEARESPETVEEEPERAEPGRLR
jgi:Ni,Fe-hydrogenase III large subunit